MEEIKCEYCGATIDANVKICPFCYTPVKAVAESAAEAISEPETKGSSTSAMVLGIISSACCWWPVGSIAGIVLGAIALSKVKKFKRENGRLDGKAIAAKVTGLIGLIAGICMTVLFIIYILIISVGVAYNSGLID